MKSTHDDNISNTHNKTINNQRDEKVIQVISTSFCLITVFMIFFVLVFVNPTYKIEKIATACGNPTETPTPKDTDGDGIKDPFDVDLDGDGVYNWNDDDIDGDGLKNDVDTDDDGDSITDSSDSTPGGYGTSSDTYPSGWGGSCSSCYTPTSTSTPSASPTPTPTSTPISNKNVQIDAFYYYKTCTEGVNDILEEPLIIASGDKIYYSFKLKIAPTNLSGVKYSKVTVSLVLGSTTIATQEKTTTNTYYPYWTMKASGNTAEDNMSPLSLTNLSNNTSYTFKVNVDIDDNGTIISFANVLQKPCITNDIVVAVARTISGEDNGSTASRFAVADSFWARWNFPNITSGHAFSRASLVRGNSSIAQLATDDNIYNGAGNTPLINTLQHSRKLAKKVIEYPNLSNGNGNIYFYKVGSSNTMSVFCADCANVGLMRRLSTFGNYYYGPTSNCQNWTTQFIKDKYDLNSTDSLTW